jgi:hypothetical protein
MPWITVLLEKMIVPKLVKKLLYIYETLEDYRAHNAQSETSSVQCTPSYPVVSDGGGEQVFQKTMHHIRILGAAR